jgi:anaerobic selenocysteine-containing dehydrogenase
MPKHWEPHETPNTAAMAKYGKTGINATSAIGSVTDYPLILTTIRVTEHYQGGVMTRNTPFLCELVSEPFIDINSYDAYKLGISNGDAVYVDTARAQNVGPFKAIVGTGTGDSQKVTSGLVAIPWHWGNKGISTGASANEVTIDALDTNIKMPEYKACLCRIHK